MKERRRNNESPTGFQLPGRPGKDIMQHIYTLAEARAKGYGEVRG
jgi:hypothetical protein